MAKAKTTAPAVQETNLPVSAINFEDDAGKGLEGADKSSYAIPFLVMLQASSPQVEKIEEAKAGMFLNSITNELYKEAFVIPCAFQRRFIRWAPRSSGGGYKGELNPADVETMSVPGIVNYGGRYLMDVPDGAAPFDSEGRPLFDHLSDTRNHFVLLRAATGIWQPALLSLSSTQIKKSKRWVSRIQGIELKRSDGSTYVPPSYSHVYSLRTAKEENTKGSWWGIEIDIVGPVESADVYQRAKDFHASVIAGTVIVDKPVQNEDEAHKEGF